jgi:hypothetical protein
MAFQKSEKPQQEGIGSRVLSGLWNAAKFAGKAVIWIAKAYWKWFENVGSDVVGSSPATVQQEVKVDTVLIRGKPYYKDKSGRYRPMEV